MFNNGLNDDINNNNNNIKIDDKFLTDFYIEKILNQIKLIQKGNYIIDFNIFSYWTQLYSIKDLIRESHIKFTDNYGNYKCQIALKMKKKIIFKIYQYLMFWVFWLQL